MISKAPRENPKEFPKEKKIPSEQPKELVELKAEVGKHEMIAVRKNIISQTDRDLVTLARKVERKHKPEVPYERLLA